MVLADLGSRLRGALGSVENVSEIEVQSLVKEICSALLENDVNVRLVGKLRDNIRMRVATDMKNENEPSANKRKKLQKIVFDELCGLVDSHEDPIQPKLTPTAARMGKKGGKNIKIAGNSSHVIMLVGLQGSGKTTSCNKLAVYYKKRGFQVGLVCADTFRAGAFDQLKQNAIKSSIPFFGSYLESNPVKVAYEGVTKFKEDKFDLIIVDTSGRHKQEQSLFREMIQISEAVEPTQTIMVMDASIGQAAEGQAKAFKDSTNFGSIILTKMDGHAKGGGAISAVAATKTPIIFMGTGEHVGDFEVFKPTTFVSRLLGIGDIQSLIEHVQQMNLQNDESHRKTIENFKEGKFTLRDFQTQMNNFLKMGPLTNIASMIPGMSNIMSQVGEEETNKKIKDMIFIMDSMSDKELDSDGRLFADEPNRIIRVARGSGCAAVEVEMVLQQQKMMASMAGAAKSIGSSESGKAPVGRAVNMQRMMQNAQANPDILQQAMSLFGGGRGANSRAPNFESMMNNPKLMQQAQQMMQQNPNMMQQAQQMMRDPGVMQKLMTQFGGLGGL